MAKDLWGEPTEGGEGKASTADAKLAFKSRYHRQEASIVMKYTRRKYESTIRRLPIGKSEPLIQSLKNSFHHLIVEELEQ